ncbi:hypothetical protein STEG23_018052 [Scotinomys teguina]
MSFSVADFNIDFEVYNNKPLEAWLFVWLTDVILMDFGTLGQTTARQLHVGTHNNCDTRTRTAQAQARENSKREGLRALIQRQIVVDTEICDQEPDQVPRVWLTREKRESVHVLAVFSEMFSETLQDTTQSPSDENLLVNTDSIIIFNELQGL